MSSVLIQQVETDLSQQLIALVQEQIADGNITCSSNTVTITGSTAGINCPGATVPSTQKECDYTQYFQNNPTALTQLVVKAIAQVAAGAKTPLSSSFLSWPFTDLTGINTTIGAALQTYVSLSGVYTSSASASAGSSTTTSSYDVSNLQVTGPMCSSLNLVQLLQLVPNIVTAAINLQPNTVLYDVVQLATLTLGVPANGSPTPAPYTTAPSSTTPSSSPSSLPPVTQPPTPATEPPATQSPTCPANFQTVYGNPVMCVQYTNPPGPTSVPASSNSFGGVIFLLLIVGVFYLLWSHFNDVKKTTGGEGSNESAGSNDSAQLQAKATSANANASTSKGVTYKMNNRSNRSPVQSASASAPPAYSADQQNRQQTIARATL